MRLSPRTVLRLSTLVFLGEVVASIFSTSFIIPTSTFIGDAFVSNAEAQQVPEIPTALIPFFAVIAIVALLHVRKSILKPMSVAN